MLVKNWMGKPAITIDEEAYIIDAEKLMVEKNIRSLPVLRSNRMVGFITDKDLKRASASEVTKLEHITELYHMISRIKVKHFMIKNMVKIPPECTIEKAAEIMLDNRLSSAPVVEANGELKGVITQTDIFRLLISLTGVRHGGIQFALLLEDRSGSIKEVTDIIRKYGGRILSILSFYDQVPEGFRKVYIRAFDILESELKNLKIELFVKVHVIYTVEQIGNENKIREADNSL